MRWKRSSAILIISLGLLTLGVLAGAAKYQSSKKSKLEERTRQAGGNLIVADTSQSDHTFGTLRDLANASSSIVVATTLSNRSLLTEDGTSIITTYRVLVQETLKGPFKPGEVVTISTPGGLRVFDKGVFAAVQVPQVRKPLNGRKYTFFIEHTDKNRVAYLTGSFQGAFELRDREGVIVADRRPGSALSSKYDGRTVTSFLHSLQSSLQK